MNKLIGSFPRSCLNPPPLMKPRQTSGRQTDATVTERLEEGCGPDSCAMRCRRPWRQTTMPPSRDGRRRCLRSPSCPIDAAAADPCPSYCLATGAAVVEAVPIFASWWTATIIWATAGSNGRSECLPRAMVSLPPHSSDAPRHLPHC